MKRKEHKYIPVDLKHKGVLITDPYRIVELAQLKKSIFIHTPARWIGRSQERPTGLGEYTAKTPAGWLINWPTAKLLSELKSKMFYEYI